MANGWIKYRNFLNTLQKTSWNRMHSNKVTICTTTITHHSNNWPPRLTFSGLCPKKLYNKDECGSDCPATYYNSSRNYVESCISQLIEKPSACVCFEYVKYDIAKPLYRQFRWYCWYLYVELVKYTCNVCAMLVYNFCKIAFKILHLKASLQYNTNLNTLVKIYMLSYQDKLFVQ